LDEVSTILVHGIAVLWFFGGALGLMGAVGLVFCFGGWLF
jgi:hypothetical protein